jgi:hypothetical protein
MICRQPCRSGCGGQDSLDNVEGRRRDATVEDEGTNQCTRYEMA